MDSNKLNQLEKLAELRDKGVLSEEEFESSKRKLLAENNQKPQFTPLVSAQQTEKTGTYWLPIPSLVLGILAVLALFDDSPWDEDEILGVALFIIVGLVLGVVGVSTQEKGRGMSIAGIVLNSIGLLLVAEMFL